MQQTAYDMRISDWSSDVCSADLLALPVDEGAADGVVAVAGGGGEAAAALVEREGEQLGVGVLGFVHTALPGRDLGASSDAEGGRDLDAAVAAMHLQSHIGMRGERCVEVVDLRVAHRPELAQLGPPRWVGPQQAEGPRG